MKKEEITLGDKIKIHFKGQAPFIGSVIAQHGGNSPSATFTVRAVLSGVGVEKIYPLHSPLLTKIEVVKK